MPDSAAANPAPDRSYCGIGSCCLFGIATACIIAWGVESATATYKMAGFEGIVLLPFSLVLYGVGAVMGLIGTREPAINPLSRTGLVLNLFPLAALGPVVVGSLLR
jgi:hypothetical protein